MNILHMKYAVEVAETGSINKASETLLIAQPMCRSAGFRCALRERNIFATRL